MTGRISKLLMLGVVCLMLCGQSATASTQIPDLVGYWPLDGDPCDALGLHHGEEMGTLGVTYDAGVIDQGAVLTGGADENWILLTEHGEWDPREGGDDITVSIWARRDAGADGGQQLFLQRNDNDWSNGDVTWVMNMATNTTRFRDYNDNANGSSLPQGEWHHICGVYNSAEQTGYCYVDGVQHAIDDDWSKLGGWPKNAISIGAMTEGGQPHTGAVDEARLFKRAFTAEEVAELAAYDGNPLFNFAPVVKVSAPEVPVGTNMGFQLNPTVEDDGMPYIEDANDSPADPTPVGLSYEWTVDDPNGAVDIDDPTALNPTIIITQAETYVFELTAYDDKDGVSPQTLENEAGKTKVAQVEVTVQENVPPVIDEIAVDPAGQLILSVDESVSLDATVSNDDTTTYSWEVLDPCAFFVANIDVLPSTDSEDVELVFDRAALGEWLRLTAGQAREIPVKLSVEDDLGQTDEMTITLEVRDPDCAIAAQEQGLATDLNNDCKITLEDFMAMTQNWLICYDPLSLEPDCDNPYAP